MTALLISSLADESTAESPAESVGDVPSDGKIPKGWELMQLASVAQLESGHTPSRNNPEYWGGDIPWLSLHDTHVLDQSEVFNTSQSVTQKGIDNSSARILPKGTVVFSRTATVGKATVLGREMATSQDFACYICGPRVHNHFLVYLFRHMAPEWRRYMAGSTHNTVYMPVFRTLRVPLPPRPEQEAIAEALRDADDLIESLEQLIEKKRLLKQGAMQDLLSGRRRLPGFEQEWETKRVGDLLIVKHGKSQSAVADQDGPYPILATGGQIGRSREFLYDKPSVLIGRKGTIDRPQFMDRPFWTVDTLFYSIVKEPNSAKFIYFAFIIIDWMRHNEASGVPSLNAKTIERIELRVPPEDEQRAIAAAITDMDEEIAALEVRLNKALQIKQGMMKELLTGRVRLV